jgi:hypothetical protein
MRPSFGKDEIGSLATAFVEMGKRLRKLEEMYPFYGQPEGQFYVIKPGLIKEPKDILTAKGLIFGHNVPTAGTTTPFLVAHELLGFECKMVLGYAGSGPSRLAFLAGESNVCGGGTGGYNTWKPFIT